MLPETRPVSAPVRTIVVDDSPLMRNAIRKALGTSDRIEVVATASNGLECLDKIAEYKPDVITLDIDMPVMNGISTVKNIMVRHQIPILIISSLVQDGFFAFEALRLGVMDFFPKPAKFNGTNGMEEEELLRRRVITAAGMRVRSVRRVRLKSRSPVIKSNSQGQPSSAVVMGTTLAGPNTVMHLVTQMPANFDGTIIVIQEIHPKVLVPFCSYFNNISPLEIVPVTSAQPLLPGRVYIGSTFGGLSVEESVDDSGNLEIRPTENGQLPINQLFSSVTRHFQRRTCGVLLTGIGIDGAEGIAEIKANGGLTIAQETKYCPYPDLVENVLERGTVDAVLSTRGIISRLKSWVRADK
jgi:two-component system chemotaxis response regulator CheB